MGSLRTSIAGSGMRMDRGGSSYPLSSTAQGVHFDGATYLSNPSLTSTDNGKASFAVWIKWSVAVGQVPIWVADPAGYYGNFSLLAGAAGSVQVELANATATTAIFADTNDDPGTSGRLPSAWTLLLASSDAALYALDIYFGNTRVTPTPQISGSSTTYAFNGLEFAVGGDGSSFLISDMACFWFAPGQSLLDGTGHIPLATRRAFIDANGNPVYLGTTGQTPTGTSPAVFLSATQGNAASFATNLGTGGAFTVNGDPLTLAAANP